MKEMRYVSVLGKVAKMDVAMEEVHKAVETLQKAVGEVNLEMALISMEQHPEFICPKLVQEFEKYGIHLPELSPTVKKMTSSCMNGKIRNPFDDIAEAKKKKAESSSAPKGVVFVKCRADSGLESAMIDELVNVAKEKGIVIQDYIVNVRSRQEVLKHWIGTDSIQVVLLHSMTEYSAEPEEQKELFQLAAEHGVSFMIGSMGYEVTKPTMDWFAPEC